MTDQYYKEIESTGEFVKVEKPVVELEPGDSVRRSGQVDYYQKKKIQTKIQKDYGPFIFLIYYPAEELNLNILSASLTRLIYLSTFLSFDGWLVTDDGFSIDKALCGEILKVSDDTFLNFWNEMIKENIFFYNNGRIYLNKNILKRGDLPKNTNAIRLNCETVRYLYEHCQSVSGHKNLSYIFKIIPWVNRTWNIICWNPEEKERGFIEYMKLGDFAEKVGYDRTHAKRLANALSKVKFKKRGEYRDKRAFLYVIDDGFKPDEWIIVMNPLVYYGGDNYKCIKGFEF